MGGATLMGLWAKQAARKESSGARPGKDDKQHQQEERPSEAPSSGKAADAKAISSSHVNAAEKGETEPPVPEGKENDNPGAQAAAPLPPALKPQDLAGISAAKMNPSPFSAAAAASRPQGSKAPSAAAAAATHEATPATTATPNPQDLGAAEDESPMLATKLEDRLPTRTPSAPLDPRASLLSALRLEADEVRLRASEAPGLAAETAPRLLKGSSSSSAALPRRQQQQQQQQLPRDEVARLVHGAREPLSELSAAICGALGAPNPTAVHNCIVGLAARTSFAAPDPRIDTVDALEDATEDLLWRWSVRDAKVMAKEHRAAATQLTKRLEGWKLRLKLLAEATQLLEAAKPGPVTAKGKLPKLLVRLEKLRGACAHPPTPAAPPAPPSAPPSAAPSAPPAPPAPSGVEAMEVDEKVEKAEEKGERVAPPEEEGKAAGAVGEEAKDEAVPMETTPGLNAGAAEASGATGGCASAGGSKAGLSVTGKDRLKEEKEKVRLEKEAEKEKVRVEKEKVRVEKEAEKEKVRVEKERQRAEKEAEKEKVRAEKERLRAEAEEASRKRKAEEEAEKEQKKAAKKGFQSTKQLDKARGVMQSFFKVPAVQKTPQPSKAEPSEEAPEDSNLASYLQVFPPCPPEQRRLAPVPLEGQRLRELDEALLGPGAPKQSRGDLLGGPSYSGWRERWREERRGRLRRVGLPPSWARKQGASGDGLLPAGADPAAVVTYRRKLLWKDTKAPRPAFYGSFSKSSSVVSGRRPFAKDEAEELGLDYECESEWDWEEPEDPEDVEECLSEGGDPEEDAAAGAGSDAEDADGFYVPDGYLSADEGGGSGLGGGGAAAEGDVMEVDSGAPPGEDDEDSVVRGTMELRRLEAQLFKAKRTGKAVVVQRTRGSTEVPWQLSALRMQVFPGAAEPIAPVKASVTGASAAGSEAHQTPADGARKTPRGRAPQTFPDELLPELLRFLVDNPALPINKATEAFVSSRGAEAPQLAKTAVKAQIQKAADYVKGGASRGWTVHADLLERHGVTAPEAKTPGAEAKAAAAPATGARKQAAGSGGPKACRGMKSNAMEKFLVRPGTTKAPKGSPGAPAAPEAAESTPTAAAAAAASSSAAAAAAMTTPQRPKQQQQKQQQKPRRTPAAVAPSPAPPTPDAARHGQAIEFTPGAAFWQEVRRWLVKGCGGAGASEAALSKGFAFAMEGAPVTESVKSMPADLVTALLKTMSAPGEAPAAAAAAAGGGGPAGAKQSHAAEACANVAEALRRRVTQSRADEEAARSFQAWPGVATLGKLLSQPCLLDSCLRAFSTGGERLHQQTAKLLAVVTRPLEGSPEALGLCEAETQAQGLLCRGIADDSGLLGALASLMADGAPEGSKASAYAAMALCQVFASFSQDKEFDLGAFSVVGEAAARAVGSSSSSSPRQLCVTKHAMRLAAALMARSPELVTGGPLPLALDDGSSASGLLRGAAVALGNAGDGTSEAVLDAGLQVAEQLLAVEGEVKDLIAATAAGDGAAAGPNVQLLWEGLQRSAALQGDVGARARRIMDSAAAAAP